MLTEIYPTDDDVKILATCIDPLVNTTRACFDAIGTPVLTYAIFGDKTCNSTASECDQCVPLAGGM